MSHKYILRRKNIDLEEDKFSYYVSCTKGVEITTPFKEKATIFKEEDKIDVISKDWEFIIINSKRERNGFTKRKK